MPHNVASDQGLQCLLTGFSIKNRIKSDKIDLAPIIMTNGLVLYKTVKESTSLQWVNSPINMVLLELKTGALFRI